MLSAARTITCNSLPSSMYHVNYTSCRAPDILPLPCRRCYEIRCANMVFSDNYNETIDRRCALLAVVPWHAPVPHAESHLRLSGLVCAPWLFAHSQLKLPKRQCSCTTLCSNVCYDTTGSLVMKIVDTCVSDRLLALHSVMSVWR